MQKQAERRRNGLDFLLFNGAFAAVCAVALGPALLVEEGEAIYELEPSGLPMSMVIM